MNFISFISGTFVWVRSPVEDWAQSYKHTKFYRFDPMKALKDEIPYSALESTPTFCKIKGKYPIYNSKSFNHI